MSLNCLQNEEEIICGPVVAFGGTLEGESEFVVCICSASWCFLVSTCDGCPW